jgi:hypothetical protein
MLQFYPLSPDQLMPVGMRCIVPVVTFLEQFNVFTEGGPRNLLLFCYLGFL